jgi:hypothetical protein
LNLAEVSIVEAYTLPPALVLLVVGAVTRRRHRQTGPWRAWGPGALAASVPSVVAAWGGGTLRPWLLLLVAAVLVILSVMVQTLRDLQVPAVVGAGTALGVGLVRSGAALVRGDLGWDRIELWSWSAVAIVLVAAAVLRLPRMTERTSRAFTSATGIAMLWVPTELAIMIAGIDGRSGTGGIVWRGGIVIALALGVAVLDVLALRFRTAERLRLRSARAGIIVQAFGAVALTVLFEVLHEPDSPEWWTVPAAMILLLFGGAAMRRSERSVSWPSLGPGTALLLLPSLLVVLDRGGTVRIVALTVIATVVVVVGALARLQAPFSIGGLVLAVHAIVQLGPEFAIWAGTVPRWVVLSLAGAVLLGLGITYEHRLAQAKTLRLRFQQMR